MPPEISIMPSLLIAAYNPAFDISANKPPIVVVSPTVIVLYSLFEFFTITVWPFEIVVPFPISFNKVADVAVVVSIITVSCNSGFVTWDFE